MKSTEIIEKVKKIKWKKLLLSRNFLIICTVMLIGCGIVVFNTFRTSDETAKEESGTKILGNAVLVENEISAEDAVAEESFFAVAVINRERSRDEAMEVLQAIADSTEALPSAKEDALRSIENLVEERRAEANIETLVKSKGFEDCVAVISGDKCSVIVKTEGLLEDEVAQILAIAVEQSGASPSGITIIEKK